MEDVLEISSFRYLKAIALAALVGLVSACEVHVPDLYGRVVGVVASAQTGEVVPGCEVVLIEKGASTLTGASGEFMFENLKEGSYTILAQKDGYYEDRKSIKIASGEDVQLSFNLRPIINVTGYEY